MAKMGRPKSDVIKDKIVTIRMSAEEHQKLRDYSEKHQQTITETLKEGVDLLYKTRDEGAFFMKNITKSRDYSNEKIERKGEVLWH